MATMPFLCNFFLVVVGNLPRIFPMSPLIMLVFLLHLSGVMKQGRVKDFLLVTFQTSLYGNFDFLCN